jgi:hypothetical protein
MHLSQHVVAYINQNLIRHIVKNSAGFDDIMLFEASKKLATLEKRLDTQHFTSNLDANDTKLAIKFCRSVLAANNAYISENRRSLSDVQRAVWFQAWQSEYMDRCENYLADKDHDEG